MVTRLTTDQKTAGSSPVGRALLFFLPCFIISSSKKNIFFNYTFTLLRIFQNFVVINPFFFFSKKGQKKKEICIYKYTLKIFHAACLFQITFWFEKEKL